MVGRAFHDFVHACRTLEHAAEEEKAFREKELALRSVKRDQAVGVLRTLRGDLMKGILSSWRNRTRQARRHKSLSTKFARKWTRQAHAKAFKSWCEFRIHRSHERQMIQRLLHKLSSGVVYRSFRTWVQECQTTWLMQQVQERVQAQLESEKIADRLLELKAWVAQQADEYSRACREREAERAHAAKELAKFANLLLSERAARHTERFGLAFRLVSLVENSKAVRLMTRAWRIWSFHWIGSEWSRWACKTVAAAVEQRTRQITGDLNRSREQLRSDLDESREQLKFLHTPLPRV